MFKKRAKIEVYEKISNEGIESTSTRSGLSVEDFFELLEKRIEDYSRDSSKGKLVIDNISENRVTITDTKSIEFEEEEDKIEELEDLLRDFIRERAVRMKAYGLFNKEKLEGVYTKEILAISNKRRMERAGVDSADLRIEEIEVKG